MILEAGLRLLNLSGGYDKVFFYAKSQHLVLGNQESTEQNMANLGQSIFPDTAHLLLEEIAAMFGDEDEVAIYQRDVTFDLSTHHVMDRGPSVGSGASTLG